MSVSAASLTGVALVVHAIAAAVHAQFPSSTLYYKEFLEDDLKPNQIWLDVGDLEHRVEWADGLMSARFRLPVWFTFTLERYKVSEEQMLFALTKRVEVLKAVQKAVRDTVYAHEGYNPYFEGATDTLAADLTVVGAQFTLEFDVEVP